MNKKALSLLIVVVMVLAAVPAGLGLASAASVTNLESNKQLPPLTLGDISRVSWQKGSLLPRRTGTIPAPLSEYEKLIGMKFAPMDSEAFKEAIEFAPFYPRPNVPVIVSPNSTVTYNGSNLPVQAVNTLYLPPIGSQGGVGSCTAWSSTYYVWTYMINWWRNNPHPSSPDVIMNPTFTYNLINGGEDGGSLTWDAMNLIATIGAVPLNAFPLYTGGAGVDPDNYAWVWPNLTQWLMAPYNSGTWDMYDWQYYEPGEPALYKMPGQWYILNLTNDTQFDYTKALLANGYVVQTTINVLPSFQFLGRPDDFLEYLVFYANYSKVYADELWNNSEYSTWTVQDLLNEAQKEYNAWAVDLVNAYYNGDTERLQYFLDYGQYSLELMAHDLQELGVSMDDTVFDAAQILLPAVYSKFIANESWWNNATFYLSTYSINGEKWFLNNGFNYLFTLANFEWMIHYVPLGKYSTRVPYVNFDNYYESWQGGHAVTMIGYDETMTTPDGNGAFVMVNSWGTDWGHDGYWYFSYPAIRSAGKYFDTTIEGILPVEFQIVWPVSWGGSSAFVYVPKAANYTPKLMAVVGIDHPVRGEVIDGVSGYTQYVPAGIPVGVMVGDNTWYHNYLDFWEDYVWDDITSETTAADLPQNHPFPDSPMAFDITSAIANVTQYLLETNTAPLNATFFVAPHDLLADNITGVVYNFTILMQTPEGLYPIGAHTGNVSIPDGEETLVSVTVPLVQYGYLTPGDNTGVNFGDFDVDIVSVIPLEGAKVVIDGKSYPLSAEEGGYYYYATAVDQKLALPAGTYNYTVVVTYPNGKEVALPTRTVTIKEPVVYIKSPEPKVYNTSEIELAVKVVDVLNITQVIAKVDGREYSLTYNDTTGLYTAELNLTNGEYTLTVTAVDEKNATGKATVNFVVATGSEVETVEVNNETNVTVGVVGGSANVTAENNTIVANVSTSEGTVTVEVPVVNNVQSVVINTTTIESVIKGEENATLVAGWNATVKVEKPEVEPVSTEKGKRLYSVTIRANVTLGENGVAVVALRNINISKIYVWKNGQKIPLTTDKSNQLGYYYKQGNIIFVVLKQDPVIEADGYFEAPIQVGRSHGVSLAALNFLGYRWYNMYKEQFDELYKKAIELGVDNETLQQALQYHETAAEYYQEVLDIVGEEGILLHLSDIRILAPLRKAYLNEIKAVEILKKAIEELENSEG